MSTALKTAIQKVKIDGKLEQFAAITTFEAVAKELNKNGTVKVSLKDELEAFAAALAEKANSTEVAQEIQTACQDLYNKILGKTNADVTINEAYDTLVEIAKWIGNHGEVASTLVNDINTLKTKVEDLMKQIENLSGVKGVEIEKSETNGNIVVDGKEIEVYKNPGKNVFVAKTEAEEVIAEQQMKDGDMLFCIVQDTIELKDASDEVKVANNFVGVISDTDVIDIVMTNNTISSTNYEGQHDETIYPNLFTLDIKSIDNGTNIINTDWYNNLASGIVYVNNNYTIDITNNDVVVNNPSMVTNLPMTYSIQKGYYRINKVARDTNKNYICVKAYVATSTRPWQLGEEVSEEFIEYLQESYPVEIE